MKKIIRQHLWKIATIITLLIIVVAVLYLYKTNQLHLLLSLDWGKIDSWATGTIIGSLILNWSITFLYNHIFPSDTEKIEETTKRESAKIHDKIDDSTEKILKAIQESAAVRGITKTEEELIQENKALREKLAKESVAEISPELQATLDKLFAEFRYKKFRETIDEFIDKNENIKQKDLAKLYYQKALSYQAEIRYQEAKQELETAVALDRTNPEILMQYGNILYHVAKYDKAIEYYKKALEILKSIHGEEHPYVATSYNNIGSALHNKGEYDKAIEYYEKALKIDLKVLGEEHPDTATDYNNIGSAWKAKGEYDKAIEYYEKALKIDLKVLGEEHPNTARDYNNIASALHNKGEYDKAIEYYEKARAILRKVHPNGHPWIDITEKNLEIAKQANNN